jgi:hypothetical protein
MESPPPPTSFNTNSVSRFSEISTYSFGESSSHNNPDVLFAPNNSMLECALFSAQFGHNSSGGDYNKNVMWDF